MKRKKERNENEKEKKHQKINRGQQASWQTPYILLCDEYLCECCGKSYATPRKPRIGQLLWWSAMACKIGIRSSADVNYFSVLHLLYTEFAPHPAPRPAGTVKQSICEVELLMYKTSGKNLTPCHLYAFKVWCYLAKKRFRRDCQILERRMVFNELKYKHAQNYVSLKLSGCLGITLGSSVFWKRGLL
jgi:hypothetical protein